MSRIVNLDNFQQFTAINVLSDPGAIGGPFVIPGACQVVLQWTLPDGKAGHNVLYGAVQPSFNPTAAIADAILTGLTTGATWTALATHMAGNSALNAVLLRDVRGPGLPVVASTGAPHLGTAAGTALPNEVALVVTLRTPFAGIQNRGRMYVPNWDITSINADNTAAATVVTALGNWASNILTVFTSNAMTWSIGHKARQQYTGSTGTVHPARPAGVVTVTQAVVRDNHFDSMRRRGLK